MSEVVPFMMAQCARSCGWIGGAHERRSKENPAEAFYCPQCSSPTRSWVLDQAKEQASLDRLKAERSEDSQVFLDAARQCRLASERLHAATAQVKRCQARLTLAEVDGNVQRVFSAKQALIAAEREEASAFIAHKSASAAVHTR